MEEVNTFLEDGKQIDNWIGNWLIIVKNAATSVPTEDNRKKKAVSVELQKSSATSNTKNLKR